LLSVNTDMQQSNDLDSGWQQPPAMFGGMPFTLQMLSTGAGDLHYDSPRFSARQHVL
jgi:hypothetical protein